LRLVPIGVGKACAPVRGFVGRHVQVAGGGRELDGPTVGAQHAAAQVEVVGRQRQAAGGGDEHPLAAAIAVAAIGTIQKHVAIACGQGQVAAIADLVQGQRAAPPTGGVEGDVTLALNDGQVGGAHQNRAGIQAQRAAGLDAGLAADGAKACGAGAHTLNPGAVERQVAGFVEDRGCATAVEATGVKSLCILALKQIRPIMDSFQISRIQAFGQDPNIVWTTFWPYPVLPVVIEPFC